MTRQWLTIFGWIIAFQVIGAFLGFITQHNMHPWYDTLAKSSLNPPAIVFTTVWPLLYVLLAISGYLLWRDRSNPKVKPALYCFIIQMLMNWAWTSLFFQLHWVLVSFIWITAIIFLTLATIILSNTTHKSVSIMLIPYLLWLIFASYLNFSIWYLN